MMNKVALTCSPTPAYTQIWDDSWSEVCLLCFYQLWLVRKDKKPVKDLPCQVIGSSNARFLMLTKHLFYWSHWTGCLCLSPSVQKISYHVCVCIIKPLIQYLSCILFCFSVMCGDSTRSPVFLLCAQTYCMLCLPRWVGSCLCRRVRLRVQGQPWVALPHTPHGTLSHCNEWVT